MIEELERLIISRWGELSGGHDSRPPAGIDFLLSSKKRKVILYAMPRGARQPALIIKVSRDESYDPFVLREFENLSEVGLLANANGLKKELPLPVLFERVKGRASVIQPFFQGKPLLWTSRDSELVLRGATWITNFHAATVCERTLSEVTRDGLYVRPLDEAADILGKDPRLSGLLGGAREVLAQASGSDLKSVFAHRDFTEDNLLFDGREMCVIDWEFAKNPGLPVLDLISLLVRSNMEQNEGGLEKSFRQVLHGEGEYGALCQVMLGQYLDRLGVARQLLPLFFVYFIVDRLSLLRSLNIKGHKAEALINCLACLSTTEHHLTSGAVSCSA